ncbi:RNA-directed DNA polymerase from mobile element jockey [Plakobranchus ocellatus]|uniref:RNA-directed DNA polymerase from mobile element jockey n=1 Tax=Plakobranchus ocellatus TaxID=259542 RepID=A0AAV4BFS7_9GAST|nr:RNA-directed DNA polymerase from mobile element jockey [Plakobranchus ocellatus]
MQGGVLSPALFLIYVNDVKEHVSRKVCLTLYADDLALISTEEEVGTAKVYLQTTLDGITRWADKWGLQINAKEYTIFSLSTKEQRGKLQIKEHTLDKNNSPSYLGVTFDVEKSS